MLFASSNTVTVFPNTQRTPSACSSIKSPGGGVLNKVLYGDAPPQGPTRYSYLPFLRGKVPLS